MMHVACESSMNIFLSRHFEEFHLDYSHFFNREHVTLEGGTDRQAGFTIRTVRTSPPVAYKYSAACKE